MKDTDKIAAEAEASLWPYHSTRQIVTATEAQQRKNHNLTIIKAAIEKAYEQGREDEYQEWIRPNYPIRAAHASDGGVCPNCGVTWDKHSHNCCWRQHASEDEVRQGEGFSIQKGFSSE